MGQRELNEVESKVKAIKPAAKAEMWLARNYIGAGQSALRYLDLKIPDVRAAFKEGFSFSEAPPSTQWKIWDFIWKNSKIFEVMLMASYWAASRPLDELVTHQKKVLGWLDRVDNWAHSDELSAHYAKLLEHDIGAFLPIFEKWSQSKRPWCRRQSLVSLLFYSRFRKRHPPVKTILNFIDRHLDDDHYFVQKGVGWALREAWNVYPVETFAFLKSRAARIPAAGWTAATEKLKPADKETLKRLRRT